MHMGSIFDFMEKNFLTISSGTLYSKMAICSQESPKNNKQNLFFHKIKNAPHMRLL